MLALACLLLSQAVQAQAPPDPCVKRITLYRSHDAFWADLNALPAIADDAERLKQADQIWKRLRNHNQIPFALGDTTVLLYRGQANKVIWNGDFNGWGDWEAAGQRLAGTDIWYYVLGLPSDARVDYKLIVDGRWIMDPENSLAMWSGFGPNSELRMPDYLYPYEALPRTDVPHGQFTAPIRISSKIMGYDLQYQVYLPHNYESLSGLPTVYVTDGHEFSPDHMGSLVAVLDNGIADGSMAPMVVVFIDARNPDTGGNRRMTELLANPQYMSFVTEELVPTIDGTYRTRTDAASRGILGTSLGGLTAAYFAIMRPDVFLRAGVMSPAFWIYPAIYALYEKPPPAGLKVYMTQGTINDGDGGRQMKQRFDRWGYTYSYHERSEGHSWGQWRAHLTGLLRYLYPGPLPTPPPLKRGDVCEASSQIAAADMGLQAPAQAVQADGTQPEGVSVAAYPNPFNPSTTITLGVPEAQQVRLEVFDVLGRRVASLFEGRMESGMPQSFRFEAGALPSALYIYRVTGETFTVSRTMFLQK